MCATCGCGDNEGPGAGVRVDARSDHEHPHQHLTHEHPHEPRPHRRPAAPAPMDIEAALLAKNDHLAAHNRDWLAARGDHRGQPDELAGVRQDHAARAHHHRAWPARRPVAVIEGDQETLLDAERIRATGAPVVQVNTGAGCHLDADMLRRGLDALDPAGRLAGVRRERRQPGLPGAVRPRRGGPGGGHLGDRGRGQAAEVPAHVRRGRRRASSTRSTCCRTSTSTSTGCAPTSARSTRGPRSCRCR